MTDQTQIAAARAAGPVQIEIVDRTGNRSVRGRRGVVENLLERQQDIQLAVATCTEILRNAAAHDADENAPGLRVTEISATFGLEISGEGSIVVSKASVEASFEVTITLGRS